MLIFILAMFALTCWVAIGEAYYERDWPRETGKFAVIYLVLLAAWVLFVN
jgi:hypothetical protein